VDKWEFVHVPFMLIFWHCFLKCFLKVDEEINFLLISVGAHEQKLYYTNKKEVESMQQKYQKN